MKRKWILGCAAVCFLWTCLCFWTPTAAALEPEMFSALPGADQWKPYLDQSPAELDLIEKDPLLFLQQLLPHSLWETLRQSVRSSADTLLFLLLASLLSFLAGETEDASLLDLATAGGCGVLLWKRLLDLAQQLCAQTEEWKNFLLGFLPVYAGVLTMSGEPTAGSAASGFFLTLLCFLAQCLTSFFRPLLQCYLALSMACCISRDHSLSLACKEAGALLHHGLGWVGKFLGILLGVQRVTSLQIDRMTLRTGKLLTGSIPIVGQSLQDASETILAGLQMLKSGLGLAAIAFLTVEFLPLYLGLLAQFAVLRFCSLLCSLTGILRCQVLLDCFAEAVQCMAVVIALFFGLTAMGTVLLFIVGGG